MAYEKFIPTIWNETINRELDRLCVFAEDCNRQYEGDVKEMGDQVRILGIGSPTITDVVLYTDGTRGHANDTITGPQEVTDTSVTLLIDHMSYFNYMVGDIDKAQAVNGVLEALSEETSERLANKVDTFIASLAVATEVTKLNTSGAATVTADNVLDTLDSAIQKLYENDVATSTEIVVTVSPRFYTLFKKAYITKDTDNSKMLENGKVAKYGNVTVKMSNNVHKTTEGEGDDAVSVDNIMIRTKRAIAYAQPLTHTEPYRPESRFADAVKGFILYGAKVVREKEIVNINVKYA